MAKTHNPRQGFGGAKTPRQLYQDRQDRLAAQRSDKRHGIINSMRQWLADQDWQDANPKPLMSKGKVVHMALRAARRTRQRGASPRSSAASGDGNSDPEPPQPLPTPAGRDKLYNQASLADVLILSKKTVQNIYSKTPWLLPPAIQVPGARGPRWTPQAVAEWLKARPKHTPAPKPIPVAPKRKAGRPRIALVSKGGVL